MNRRTLFTKIASLAGLAVISTYWSQALAERKRGGGASPSPAPAAGGGKAAEEIKMVDPKSPQAVAVNYVEKKSDLKNDALKTERGGMKWDQQFCKNCAFYSNPKQHKGMTVGNCTIFSGFHVASEGWCATWNKKA